MVKLFELWRNQELDTNSGLVVEDYLVTVAVPDTAVEVCAGRWLDEMQEVDA